MINVTAFIDFICECCRKFISFLFHDVFNICYISILCVWGGGLTQLGDDLSTRVSGNKIYANIVYLYT